MTRKIRDCHAKAAAQEQDSALGITKYFIHNPPHKRTQRLQSNHDIVLQGSSFSDPDISSHAKPRDHPS